MTSAPAGGHHASSFDHPVATVYPSVGITTLGAHRCVGGDPRIDVLDPVPEADVADAKLTGGEPGEALRPSTTSWSGLRLQPVKE